MAASVVTHAHSQKMTTVTLMHVLRVKYLGPSISFHEDFWNLATSIHSDLVIYHSRIGMLILKSIQLKLQEIQFLNSPIIDGGKFEITMINSKCSWK